jgi:crotonobetainyl-CoA:carnitine CoA-transferase CaiB-like acyl-CoA transferase
MAPPMPETTGAPTGRGSLDHLVVTDFSRVLAGPLASQILGDLGADVIKIEKSAAWDLFGH